jgi:hypothetical protein
VIELIEGFWCDVWEVRAVKAIGKDKCSLFLSGMGALDGFIIEHPAEDVVQAILGEREKCDEDVVDADDEE